MILCTNTLANATGSIDITSTANGSFNSYLKSDTLHGQFEISLFIDATVQSNTGGGFGYIYQNQGLSNQNDIVNNILYLNVWHSWFPESLPGKLSLSLHSYQGSDRSGQTTSGNTPPQSNSSNLRVSSFIDSLDIYNPVLSFMNYRKTFYIDVPFSHSTYSSSDSTIDKLKVKQWSPAIGTAFNNQYDWIQLRAYSIDLSNDSRTPGIDHTNAYSLSWSHWFDKQPGTSLNQLTISVLNGKRLYAVDHESRKIYNLTDMQTASLTIGAVWNKNTDSDWYMYFGYEQYKDVSTSERYNSVYVYTGLLTRW